MNEAQAIKEQKCAELAMIIDVVATKEKLDNKNQADISLMDKFFATLKEVIK